MNENHSQDEKRKFIAKHNASLDRRKMTKIIIIFIIIVIAIFAFPISKILRALPG